MILTQEYKEDWSSSSKLLFRFFFSYFILYILFTFTSGLFESPFRWLGDHILKIDYSYDVSGYGSGDNTYAYVTLFANLVFSIVATIIWSLFDRHRKSYNQLFYWFTVILRAYLVFFMLTYGFVKIYQTQFPSPSLTRLLRPLGEFSPMGLAWTYMGYSEGFNFFAGFMEVLGGLLLIPRRTQTLGAFVTAGVMIQVAVMNFMFDIPVKLFSLHLVLMALVIFSTDLKRFINVFIKNKSVDTYKYYHPVVDKLYHNIIFWVKTVSLLALVSLFCFQGYTRERSWGNKREKPPLYGIWEVNSFIKGKDTIPPLTTDSNRWRYLIIDYKDRATIKMMDDKSHNYKFKPDTLSKQIIFYGFGEKNEKPNFSYELLDSETLKLNGELYLYDYEILLKKKDLNDFTLYSRGFNWINERPFNR